MQIPAKKVAGFARLETAQTANLPYLNIPDGSKQASQRFDFP